MNDDELGARVGAALRELYPPAAHDSAAGFGWAPARTQPTGRARRPVRWLPVGLAAAFVAALAVTLSLRLSNAPSTPTPTSAAARPPTASPSASSTPAGGVRVWRQDGLTLRFPTTWVATDFRGTPAPTAFPLVYLSEYHLGGGCPAAGVQPTDRPGPSTCFNGADAVPDHTVIIQWLKIELPTSSAADQPGRTVTIDHRQARIQNSPNTVSVAIPLTTDPRDHEYFQMQAHFGAHAPRSDHEAVAAMLTTLQINR